MLHIPLQFLERIKFRRCEELGYLIAYEDKQTQDIVVTNMTSPTYGDFAKVSSSHFMTDALNEFLASNPKFTAIPYHTHPIEKPSACDLRAFRELESTGIVYYSIGTPTRTLFFRVFNGAVYSITKYNLVTRPSQRMTNLSREINSRLRTRGIESYSL